MKMCKCDLCGDNFRANNIAKHQKKCNGQKCFFKQKELNPTNKLKKLSERNWIEIQQFYDDSHSVKECIDKFDISFAQMSKAAKKGFFKVRSQTETKILRGNLIVGAAAYTTQQRSELAKHLKLGGYRPNAGKSKKFKVVDSLGNLVTLQSTYEFKFAEILNEFGLKWIRPNHLKYGNRKYFADFFLPDYSVFFDTKNDYLIKKDSNKIAAVIAENNVKLIVINKDQINIDYIRMCLNS